jgi:hypothetical protein
LSKNGQGGEASGPLVPLVDEKRTFLVYREAYTEGQWMTFDQPKNQMEEQTGNEIKIKKYVRGHRVV